MLSFSLDWHCVIAVESGEPAGSSVVALAQAHREGRAEVALLATSASESLRDRTFPGSYALFEDRVRAAGLDDLPVQPAPSVWSLSFYGHGYYVEIEKYQRVKAAIWDLLFPSIEEEPWHRIGDQAFRDRVHTPEMKRWRNAWCDVHNLVTHIDHHRDVFATTNTRDFQRNAARLFDIGVKRIATPAQACALVGSRANLH